MPRARLLKPGFFKNEDLARLSERHRLLYAGLWTLADREGRLKDRPERIKGELFPYEDVDIEPLLADLAQAGFIVRYSYDDPHGGKRGRSHAIVIPTFLSHQTPHHREGKSSIPPPTSKRAHHSPPITSRPPLNDQPKASLGPASDPPTTSRTVPVYGDPVPEGSESLHRTGTSKVVPPPPPLDRAHARARAAAAEDTRSGRVVYRGQRLKVHDFTVDDLRLMLGRQFANFNVKAWLDALDHELTKTDVVLPTRDGGSFVLERTAAEARRRGLQIVESRPGSRLTKSSARLIEAVANVKAMAHR
jgi:hypothetical protein